MDSVDLLLISGIALVIWGLALHGIIKSAVKDALKETNEKLDKLDKKS